MEGLVAQLVEKVTVLESLVPKLQILEVRVDENKNETETMRVEKMRLEAQLEGYHKLVKEQFDSYRIQITEVNKDAGAIKSIVEQVATETSIQNTKIDKTYVDASAKIGELDGLTKANQASVTQALGTLQTMGTEMRNIGRWIEDKGGKSAFGGVTTGMTGRRRRNITGE